ncbi:RsmE family RNA methyltransferase [Desulfobulbus oligotrophicus]|uniref:Ribosomal RNA small subunit methyltransferase E n=1 Tax=Desulfobulbus oligotrophicus TaxID=1909699 RepID=A0A7T5VBW7_9BACT|nr:RsmE family RNA methyltransferase [Desulfobulbus oligotrophicus]QQG65054.1 16S rRNA (uracil(1498)-N(3))-methyltransferase [Desulfobulbus oligotrophicus]
MLEKAVMRRFFLSDSIRSDDRVILTGAEARHIASVCRLKAGHKVELFDGEGNVYTTVLETVDKNSVTLVIEEARFEITVEQSPLTLAQGLLKGKKMDLVIQKATELGVHTFLPLESRYCENQGARNRQLERWQRISIEACKQCHRTAPMRILPVTPLAQADFSIFRHRLVAYEDEKISALPQHLSKQPGAICLVLGPEGGLHAEDLHVLQQWNFTVFSLGRLILRAETAALAATAIVRYLSGGLEPVDRQLSTDHPSPEMENLV